MTCVEGDTGWSVPSGDLEGWKKTIWVIIKVCRRWRFVGINHARLWSSVTISLDKSRSHSRSANRQSLDSPNNAFLLGAQLQRSGSHILTISLHSTGSVSRDNRLLQPLLSASSRWGHVTISIPYSAFTLLSPMCGFLQSLHTLSLAPGMAAAGDTKKIDVFEFAPNLRALRVSSVQIIMSRFSLPVSQITSFEWQDAPGIFVVSRNLEMLRHMPDLSECVLDCRTEDESASRMLSLPKLRRLVLKDRLVKDRVFGCVGRVLQNISSPVLEELNLTLDILSSPRDILYLIRRSQC